MSLIVLNKIIGVDNNYNYIFNKQLAHPWSSLKYLGTSRLLVLE